MPFIEHFLCLMLARTLQAGAMLSHLMEEAEAQGGKAHHTARSTKSAKGSNLGSFWGWQLMQTDGTKLCPAGCPKGTSSGSPKTLSHEFTLHSTGLALSRAVVGEMCSTPQLSLLLSCLDWCTSLPAGLPALILSISGLVSCHCL